MPSKRTTHVWPIALYTGLCYCSFHILLSLSVQFEFVISNFDVCDVMSAYEFCWKVAIWQKDAFVRHLFANSLSIFGDSEYAFTLFTMETWRTDVCMLWSIYLDLLYRVRFLEPSLDPWMLLVLLPFCRTETLANVCYNKPHFCLLTSASVTCALEVENIRHVLHLNTVCWS